MPPVSSDPAPASFDHSILITSAPTRVLGAFFDPVALTVWWQAARSVTTARPLGIYAVEWDPTSDADEVLGRLGGVFYGIVVDYKPGRELFVADAWWIPPDGDPVGPMSLQVNCDDGRTGLPAARPAERLRGRHAVAAVLQRHRARLAHVDGRAEGIRRGADVNP